MTVRSRVVLCLISVVVAGALAACGGSNAVTGPEMAGSAPTATIAGTVVSASVAGAPAGGVSYRSAAGGLRVSVVGTSLQTTTDDAGRFSLGGVSAGEKVELRFEGPGIDARLAIEGLAAGQVLTINVSVSGASASMMSSNDEVEFRGTVDSVGTDSLVVAGRTVQVVPGTTELLGRQNQPVDLSDIAPGAFVEVEGWEQPGGSVLGKKVKLEDGDGGGEDDAEVEFRGAVDSVGSSSLVVAGRAVTVVPGTTQLLGRENQPIDLSGIAPGAFVEVEGWPQADGSFIAKKVKLEDDDDGENEDDEVEFTGSIQGISPLTVSGRRVTTNGSTRILDDDNNPIALSALQVGMRVEVEGWAQPDGGVLAKKIKIQD